MDVQRPWDAAGRRPAGEGRWTIAMMAFVALLLTLVCVGHQAGVHQDPPAAAARAVAGPS